MFLKPSVGQTKHICRPDVAFHHWSATCRVGIPVPPVAWNSRGCWSGEVVHTGAQVIHRPMAQDQKTPPSPICWLHHLTQGYEREVGIPISNEDNCFTSQSRGRLKIETDLSSKEKRCDNPSTQEFMDWDLYSLCRRTCQALQKIPRGASLLWAIPRILLIFRPSGDLVRSAIRMGSYSIEYLEGSLPCSFYFLAALLWYNLHNIKFTCYN